MHTRPAKPADLYDLSVIASESLMDDELFEWLCPHRKQYPEDFRNLFLRRLKARYYNPETLVYVAETDENDKDWSGKSIITGYAAFVRGGPTSYKHKTDTPAKKLERTLLSFTDKYYKFFRLDHSIDSANLRQWREIITKSNTEVEDNWHLATLSVAPAYQRRGVGSMLVDIILDFAKRENICSLVDGSRAGSGMYKKKGYKILFQFQIPDNRDMGYSMRFDPSDMAGKTES